MIDQRTKPKGAMAPGKPAPTASTAKPETAAAPAPKPVVKAPEPKPVIEPVKAPTPPVPEAAKVAPVQAKPAPVAPKIEQAAKASPAPVPAVKAKAAPKPKPVAPVVKAARPVPKAAPIKTTTIATITQAAPKARAGIEGSKIMNEAVTKVQDTAKTFTADAGTRAQAMLGDVTERAKGAYEKSVKMAEDMTEFQKGNVEAMVESTKLVAKGAETLGQEAADYARKSFEHGSAAFKTFASAKSPTDLFKLQSDYMKTSFDAAVAETSKMTEAWLKLAGEIVQPMSNRVAVAMEKARATAL